MKRVPWTLVLVYLACGVLAIAGHELHHKPLEAVFKPLTTILLCGFIARPWGRFQTLVICGVLLSVVGDVALLWGSQTAFAVGLGGFLLAHVSYIAGFVGVGKTSPRVAVVGVIFMATTVFLLKTLWPYVGPLRIPVIIYASAITTMVTTAWSTPGGRLTWGWPAAIGAVLFYISDSSLSVETFLPGDIPHASFLTMGVYWLGQLGIVLAARSGMRPS